MMLCLMRAPVPTLRLFRPLKAPSTAGSARRLPSAERASSTGGSLTLRPSSDSGGAMFGQILATMIT